MCDLLSVAFPSRLVAACLAACLSAVVAPAQDATATPARRPNIVLILVDDLGYSDLGCYGGEIETPHLDRLAAGGLRFRDFHNEAKCAETRATLLSGLRHHQTRTLKRKNHVTLAEVARAAGYATMMSGKWHVDGHPLDRGFDRFFGFLTGAVDHYTGVEWRSQRNRMMLGREEYPVGEGYYSTDALTDHALAFVDEALDADAERPFFLYLAYNAPHYPLQAPPEDVARYRGRFAEGWDVLRERRLARMRELGIADEGWQTSPRDPNVEPWDELSAAEHAFLEPFMEVYAAMVDRIDQNVGRLVARLAARGEFDETLILFMSDNGACPYPRNRRGGARNAPHETWIGYDARWAHLCNAPLRLHKQYAHEGGTSSPLVAHWPAGIAARGDVTGFTAHLVDVMPTLVDLVGGAYPGERAGEAVLPMEGESLVAAFGGAPERSWQQPLCWEYVGNHAIRQGRWKLVAERHREWELYDLATDRAETVDLAAEHPDRVAALAAAYDAWATRVGAATHDRCVQRQPSRQSQRMDLDAILGGR